MVYDITDRPVHDGTYDQPVHDGTYKLCMVYDILCMVYDITDDHRPVHDGTYKVCMVDDITADNASEKREAQGYFGIDSSFSSSSHYSSSV